MSIEIMAYKCERCGKLYEDKEVADNCCRCKMCKYYIGKVDKKFHLVHCSRGYTCDSFASNGKRGTFSRFE